MKILIVSHYFYPHIGGIEIVVYNQAKKLKRLGHSITVVTSKLETDNVIKTKDGVQILRIPALNILEKLFDVPYPLFSPSLFFKLMRQVRENDIIHVHGVLYGGSLIAAMFARIYGKSIIVTEHVGFVGYRSAFLNVIENFAFATFGRITLYLSDKVLVLNPQVKQYLQQYTNKKIDIITNGVDTTLFHPVSKKVKVQLRQKYALPIEKMLVLFVGRFVQKKGIETILEAKDKKYDLVFIGSGNFPDYNKNNQQIHVVGKVSQIKLAEYYQACDLFLLPSQGEGFPLSIQEAMASGLPIITTEHNFIDQKINKKLIKFVQPTALQIKEAINVIMRDRRLMGKMSQYSYNFAIEKYSWDNHVKCLLKIFSEVKYEKN